MSNCGRWANRVKQNLRPPDLEAWERQMFKVQMFDNLIYNSDRHLNNILITEDWKVILIDHSRTFWGFERLRDPQALARFSRPLLQAMQRLDEKTLSGRVGKYLTDAQIKAVLKRRDLIIARAAELVNLKGEDSILFP